MVRALLQLTLAFAVWLTFCGDAVAQGKSTKVGSTNFTYGVFDLGSIGTVERRFTIPVRIANPGSAVVNITIQTRNFNERDNWTHHIGGVRADGIEVYVRRTDAGAPGAVPLAFHYMIISGD